MGADDEKTATDVEMKDVEVAKDAKDKEAEADAPAETRPKVAAAAVGISASDSTMNTIIANEGTMLMSLTDGGAQYLLAGARSTAGVKSGRYLMEIRVVEAHARIDTNPALARAGLQKQVLRIGVTHKNGPLFFENLASEGACFDSEGFFMAPSAPKKKACARFAKDTVVGFLLNLDAASPNANTMSLFFNGVRACEPMPIPDSMLGKPLFPTLTYRNMTVQVNFGPAPLAPLPFRCAMLGDAASSDVEVVAPAKPADGKYQIVFPVGLPEQGYFDWVDSFVEKNPEFVELSDRKIVEWLARSGHTRPKPTGTNDKPDMKYGIPQLDDLSVRKMITTLASSANRSFVVPELRLNLLETERKVLLGRFALPKYRKVAKVLVGEPSNEYKAKVQQLMVQEKKDAILAERRKKKLEADRMKQIEERKKKAAEMLRKKREGEPLTEEKEEPAAPAEEEVEEEIIVELTDEEKALWYRKFPLQDVSEMMLSKVYTDFSLPSTAEGFDEVGYEWQPEAAAAEALKDWKFGVKLKQRVDDIKPGEWFTTEWSAWSKKVSEWKKNQAEYKDPAKRKAMLAELKKKAAEDAKEKGIEDAPELEQVDASSIDVGAVEDVADIGAGQPLFAAFSFEDWALLSLRAELFFLLHAFKKDVGDADRPSFTEKDLPFYFQKYFKKPFNFRTFAVANVQGLAALVKEVLAVEAKTSFLEVRLPEDTAVEHFVRLTESHRRDRQRRLDAGDESAELKFPKTAAAASAGAGGGGGGVGPSAARPTMLAPQKRPAPTPVAAAAAASNSAWVPKQGRTGLFGGLKR